MATNVDPFDYDELQYTSPRLSTLQLTDADVIANVSQIVRGQRSAARLTTEEKEALVFRLREIISGNRPVRTHELKTLEEPYHAVISGNKTCEIRENDRDFRVGDKLWLMEWSRTNNRHTGRGCLVLVTHIIAAEAGSNELPACLCVMSIKLLEDNRPFPVR